MDFASLGRPSPLLQVHALRSARSLWALAEQCTRVFVPRLAYPTSPIFFVVESYLTLGLVGDTALRMVWQRAAFWAQCGNVFDVCVSALSIVCFAVYMADIDQELEERTASHLALAALRCSCFFRHACAVGPVLRRWYFSRSWSSGSRYAWHAWPQWRKICTHSGDSPRRRRWT